MAFGGELQSLFTALSALGFTVPNSLWNDPNIKGLWSLHGNGKV
jgi:hypothetical protein